MTPNEVSLGIRVYIRELDVFGKVAWIGTMGTITVECEWPMPGYHWHGTADRLRPA